MSETALFPPNQNPGLAPFELTEYQGVRGQNFFVMSPNLARFLKDKIPADEWTAVSEHLDTLGQLVGGRLDELAEAAHQEGKYGTLEKYDRHGKRIDKIVYCEEQKEIRRLCYDAGVVNLDCHPEWEQSFRYEHREACAYLLNMNGEMGVTCPLAMTEGTIEILRTIATDEQKKKWLPLLTDPDSPSHFMAGQYLTERVGGSNIGANRTVARPAQPQEQGPGSKWILHGEKWFCSNPGDVWLTTAKVDGSDTIGVFVVGRLKDDGTLNNHNILRLKDIIGSRGKVTAEVEYNNVEAELVGRKATGLAHLIKHVITVSRIHTGLGAVAGGRRAFWEARAYSRRRQAFGKHIGRFASVRRNLAVMQTKMTALELAVFHNWSLRDSDNPASAILSPLMKYIGTRHSEQVVHDAILMHGGNGILGDYSILPRLRNDAIINETWEGTHQIIAGHVVKAFGRTKNQQAFWKLLAAFVRPLDDLDLNKLSSENQKAVSAATEFMHNQKKLLETLDIRSLGEDNYVAVCEEIFKLVAISLLAKEALVDLQKNDGDSVYLSMLAIYQTILEYGVDGLWPAQAITDDEARLDTVINF